MHFRCCRACNDLSFIAVHGLHVLHTCCGVDRQMSSHFEVIGDFHIHGGKRKNYVGSEALELNGGVGIPTSIKEMRTP